MLCLLFMKGDLIMQENQKAESFKLVLNLSSGKKIFFLPHFIPATDAFIASEWTEKLSADRVHFDLLKKRLNLLLRFLVTDSL